MKSFVVFILIGAVAFGQGFNYTQVLRRELDEVPMHSLDLPPFVIPLGAPQYPSELRGTGIVGRIGVMASVTKEGNVHWVVATNRNDCHFKEPVLRAIKDWRFSTPLQNANAVAAFVRFTVVVSEDGQLEVIFDPRKAEPHH